MSALQAANRLRTAFTKGAGPSFGLWQMIPGANVSRVLARSPGVDWVLVDCEHGNIDGTDFETSIPVVEERDVI
ncbi:aldolase citrate lyase family protein [Colletotrichum tofieldiae]|nr:aldolase citrate lyase family protein [Colletotrichum tofieldiae]